METWQMAKADLSNVQGQTLFRDSYLTLFNLEGALSARNRRAIARGGIAQLGERLPCTQEVSGSIPLISTNILRANSNIQNLLNI